MSNKLTDIEDMAALERILAASGERPVLIFKHSGTWPVSRRAHREVEEFLTMEEASEVDTCRIVIQSARDISQAVAKKTGVRHQSPQILLIRSGGCVWNASHRTIDTAALKEAIRKH